MKIKISQLIAADAALAELRDARLPAATALRVALVVNATQAPLQAFQDAYNKLIAVTGRQREDDKTRYDVVDVNTYKTESQELLDQEVDIPLERKITNLGSAELRPSTILSLDWLIDIQEIV